MPEPMSPHSSVTLSKAFEDRCTLLTINTNVFRASGSAEELILNFGLDAHRHTPDGGAAALMLQRLVLTLSHAKRLALMLRDLVQLHETATGVIPLNLANRSPTPPPT